MNSSGYIETIRPGLYSSIQDMGRTHFLSYGVPIGGAMDRYAHKLANLYLQNEEDAATLEMTFVGPELQFSSETEIVITGADLSPKLNGQPVSNSVVIQIKAEDILSFGSARSGVRAYLGIKHGFKTLVRLGSRGWTIGITPNSRLEEGMKLTYVTSAFHLKNTDVGDTNAIVAEREFNMERPVGVFRGPEFHLLTAGQQAALLEGVFTIGKASDRMGIQLDGQMENNLEPIITGPVLPGTVQLTPSGRLIVLMRDCQTTGGYPRILQLTNRGLDHMAQKTMGKEVSWQLENIDGINGS